MIVKHLSDLKGTDDEVYGEKGTWVSRRFLLKKDGMGFSFHETTIFAGTETYLWYKNHLEAVYCVGGEGEIEDLGTGKIHPIKDGTMYALNNHDKHYLRSKKDMRLICVFNPPLVGREDHDEDGAYPLLDE
ncbi:MULTISPECIES: ectoine synthase [Flexistipes]|uniref:L-ectoine synthase n=1 Tax=Flexistipes sinusarabici (strain ATCC 49648 / DSM 4947 / MAS 10) TaxID=717231 RepID=F8E4K6_FLESM|nr:MULTISPECIES: ectoine synthase [Flexistipes]AEI14492.1 L-ectoine synthase [Flexistipes sinusarabici DSM 4947]MEC9492242.1 ectoine synthase [Flexistipes sp.]